ncbi:hypothetical protein RZ540_10835, partial [Acinetobacter baumannii]|nr:hypothetical protein [Acinetobacter baumannii]
HYRGINELEKVGFSGRLLKNFQLTAYKCDISKNAFGASKDAILLENQDKRIFVYSTSKDCNEMLEVRNANAP